VSGKIGGKSVLFKVPVHLPEVSEEHDTIATVWARKQIERLETDLLNRYGQSDWDGTVEEITRLALDYRLMSQYTAFVAVEEIVRRNENGELVRVVQPVELPDGVSREGIFGSQSETKFLLQSPSSSRAYGRVHSQKLGRFSARGQGAGGGGVAYGSVGGRGRINAPAPVEKEEEEADVVESVDEVKPLSGGVRLKLASLQGGSRKDRRVLGRWIEKAIKAQRACLSRRNESASATLKLEIILDEDGTINRVVIRDRAGLHNLTIRCVLFALRGKISGPVKAGTYKVALRLEK
jgi:hypothetical protein